jgi:hypothetical protein
MTLGGPRRVHIAPQGFEKERIYEPAIEQDADLVILLVHDADEKDGLAVECQEEVTAELEKADIECQIRQCDIFDLKLALAEFQNLIYQHQTDSVFVNISTGSKITAIAAMLACMMAGGTPYYVKPEDYGESTVSTGVQDSFSVAAYPIDPPSEDTVRVLEFIKEGNKDGTVIIGNLNEFVNEEEIGRAAELSRDQEDNIYDIVRQDFLTPLKQRDLIHIQRYGTEKRITLTEQGEQLLEFSRYVIEE